jgi:hypothetical protein
MRALGAAVDRIPVGAADKTMTEPMLHEILASGWQMVTYRQNTELHAEAWHWSPRGTWSDPAGRGYFTGSSEPVEMIHHSWATRCLTEDSAERVEGEQLLGVDGWRHEHILEEQSLLDSRFHR